MLVTIRELAEEGMTCILVTHEMGFAREVANHIYFTDRGVIVEHVRAQTGKEGFNAQTGEYEDLMKAGVIDPAKVTRSTLQNAASIAGLLITTEAIVAEEKEEAPPAMPAGGDMHGMM